MAESPDPHDDAVPADRPGVAGALPPTVVAARCLPERVGQVSFAKRLFRAVAHRGCRLLRLSYCTLIAIERPLDLRVPQYPLAPGYTVRTASDDDLSRLEPLVRPRKLSLFGERLSRGMTCYMALCGEDVASFGWLAFREERETNSGITLPLKEGDTYWFDTYTVESHRRRGLNFAITVKALRELQEQGYRMVRALVAERNTASRRAFAKLGFRSRYRVECLCVFGWRYHRWRRFEDSREPGGDSPCEGPKP